MLTGMTPFIKNRLKVLALMTNLTIDSLYTCFLFLYILWYKLENNQNL